jgi:UDP-glucose 4-epimerase
MTESHLVIGSSGVFGTAYIKTYGNKVGIIAISRNNSGKLFGDKFDISSMQEATKRFLSENNVTRVIFCAQHSNYREISTSNIKKLYEVNDLLLLATLLSSSDEGCDVTYFSSGSVYADSDETLSEASPIRNPSIINPYVASKISAEYFSSSIMEPSKLLVLRPFFMFGRTQKDQTLIPNLVRRVKLGEAVNLQGEYGLEFNPIYADDAAQMVYELQSNKASGIFNLSGSRITNIKEITETIGDILDESPVFSSTSVAPPRIIGANAKILQHIKGFSETSLKLALSSMI